MITFSDGIVNISRIIGKEKGLDKSSSHPPRWYAAGACFYYLLGLYLLYFMTSTTTSSLRTWKLWSISWACFFLSLFLAKRNRSTHQIPFVFSPRVSLQVARHFCGLFSHHLRNNNVSVLQIFDSPYHAVLVCPLIKVISLSTVRHTVFGV